MVISLSICISQILDLPFFYFLGAQNPGLPTSDEVNSNILSVVRKSWLFAVRYACDHDF